MNRPCSWVQEVLASLLLFRQGSEGQDLWTAVCDWLGGAGFFVMRGLIIRVIRVLWLIEG